MRFFTFHLSDTPPYILPGHKKIVAPPMVYISGEEMTQYTMSLILKQWIDPHIDTKNWEFYDMSCKKRDETDDQILKDAVNAGKRLGSIFKEPTITPSAIQVKKMGLKKPLPSPNGTMRRGWRGVTISRDTIHIEGKTFFLTCWINIVIHKLIMATCITLITRLFLKVSN
jgi:isocitrate dehydrogenase